MKDVSMQDIADKLGITRALVSLALSNKYGVNEETRAQILFTAVEMGYNFNRIKKMKSAKTDSKNRITLLLMQQDLSQNNFWNEVIRGVEERCYQLDFDLNVEIWNEQTLGNKVFSDIIDSKSKGIVTLNHFPIHAMKQYEYLNLPIVLIDNSKYFGSEFNHIRVNNYDGGAIAAEYLFGKGHRRMMFVGDVGYAHSFLERARGFEDYIKQFADVSCDFVTNRAECEGIVYNREQFFGRLRENPPTAIMCVNDSLATRVYSDLRSLGLMIGKDVSVMSFDCSRASDSLAPRLTGIDFDKASLGVEAVNVLQDLFLGRERPPRTVLLPVSVLERESVSEI